MRLLVLLLCSVYCSGHVVKPSCASTESVCVFNLTLSNIMSMMIQTEEGGQVPVLVFNNGTAYRRTGCNSLQELSTEELSRVVTVDGTYKPLVAVNNQIPGPPLVIYQGQEIVVNVENKMYNEAASLHFHGVHQKGTPWMDGVSGLTQCPIVPEKSFTYRFTADVAGTYWYHSHTGTQRSDGQFGAFIVLPDEGHIKQQSPERADAVQEFDEDFYLFVHVFHHKSAWEVFYQELNGIGRYSVDGYDCKTEMCESRPHSDSVLINGKGWYYPPGSDAPENPGIPLETLRVTQGNRYRFRVIQPSLAEPLLISIDQHKLHVIATDLCDVTVTSVDYLMISPGERFDFYIDADDPDSSGLYWIRAETITKYPGIDEATPEVRHSEAVLFYENRNKKKSPPSARTNSPISQPLPASQKHHCHNLRPCTVLNCPFRSYPLPGLTCIDLLSMDKVNQTPTLQPSIDEEFREFFLRFRAGSPPVVPNINNRLFTLPEWPPVLYPFVGSPSCEETCGNTSEACRCSYKINVNLGDVVQLVFISTAPHPVHLHGHVFQVVKFGYPQSEESEPFPDLTCADKNCNSFTWSDQSWAGGNIPGIKQAGVVEKDTVTIPGGGYVVVRFKADNPGFWFLHCHMEYHNLPGMALVIQEGSESDMLLPPPELAQCAPPHINHRSAHQLTSQAKVDSGDGKSDRGGWSATSSLLVITLSAVSCGIIIVSIVVYKRKTRHTGYTSISH